MSKVSNIETNVSTTAESKAFVPPVMTAPKKPTTQDDLIRQSIANGKHFKLVRKVYQGTNGKFYFSYSVVLIMKNNMRVKEIQVTPATGYVGTDDVRKLARVNSSGYSVLNCMYDFGNGADLYVKEETSFDRFGNERRVFSFYALSADSSGVVQEFPLQPQTLGDKSALLAAFTGFGGVRDWDHDDFTNCADDVQKDIASKLGDVFVGYLAPGRYIDVTVENG